MKKLSAAGWLIRLILLAILVLLAILGATRRPLDAGRADPTYRRSVPAPAPAVRPADGLPEVTLTLFGPSC